MVRKFGLQLGSKNVDYDLTIERKAKPGRKKYLFFGKRKNPEKEHEEWGKITGKARIDSDYEALNKWQEAFMLIALNNEYKAKEREMKKARSKGRRR